MPEELKNTLPTSDDKNLRVELLTMALLAAAGGTDPQRVLAIVSNVSGFIAQTYSQAEGVDLERVKEVVRANFEAGINDAVRMPYSLKGDS